MKVVLCRWLFFCSCIYGLLLLTPQYFLEQQINRDYPPAISHPEYFYGFLGVALSWQLAFLLIATDPIRYQWFMPIAVVEKFSFGIAGVLLYWTGRMPIAVLVFCVIDMIWGILFLWAFFYLRRLHSSSVSPTPPAS